MFCKTSQVQLPGRDNPAYPQILLHALEVKTNGLLVEVPVLLDLQTRVAEDGYVVAPRGVRDVDGLRVREEPLEECTTNAQGTCP